MAKKGTAERRVNLRADTNVRYRVVGTAAYAPDQEVREKSGQAAPAKKHAGRKKSTVMFSPGYVLFLAVISAATVLMCVHYLGLKARIVSQTRENEKLEAQLVAIRSENDALLENVNNTVDWNHIKDIAINKMGMKYATEEQIVWYNTDDSCFIRQYADVPHS